MSGLGLRACIYRGAPECHGGSQGNRPAPLDSARSTFVVVCGSHSFSSGRARSPGAALGRCHQEDDSRRCALVRLLVAPM